MFSRRQSYFSRMARTYPILKLVDVYDRQSFIRAYVLDNVFVCILMHVLFYVALWYATAVARKMEKSNKEMLKIMEQNRTRLEDVMALKDKKAEYDEVVIKTNPLNASNLQLPRNQANTVIQMQRLSTEVTDAADKLSELEGIVKKVAKITYKSDGKWCESSAGDVAGRENENAEPSLSEGQTGSHENLKILEPSFPPPQPPEPPPRKYGIFVSRPPGQRRPPPAAAAAGTPPKIGFNPSIEPSVYLPPRPKRRTRVRTKNTVPSSRGILAECLHRFSPEEPVNKRGKARDRPIRSRRVAAECPTFTDNSLGPPPWFRIIHSHSATLVDRGSVAEFLRRDAFGRQTISRSAAPDPTDSHEILQLFRPSGCSGRINRELESLVTVPGSVGASDFTRNGTSSKWGLARLRIVCNNSFFPEIGNKEVEENQLVVPGEFSRVVLQSRFCHAVTRRWGSLALGTYRRKWK
ncbi:hypothetical protein WN48_03747 [Eufriesea mexicana]|uniref:Uncharacterized protein n=1 Tax=Eufriesea mexicana TaxID=516756 RepID=A0A310SE54_9HYME|nr:hypothetical protein WN48_03747 [Eufriesea mexicana]